MSTLEPRSILDPSNGPVTGPDGYEYKGMPDTVKEGLQEMWNPETTNKRKKELQAWEKKVRLAQTLGQKAVPNPPVCATLQKERMTAKPVAVSTGGRGWGADQRPVGQRQGPQQQFAGWAGVPGATIAQPATKQKKASVPGAQLASEKKEKKEKPPKEKKPKAEGDAQAEGDSAKAEPKKPAAAAVPVEKEDFSKKSYPDTAKALRNLTKKVKQVEKIRDEGAKDEAQEEKLLKLPAFRQEMQYVQGLVNKNITSQ